MKAAMIMIGLSICAAGWSTPVPAVHDASSLGAGLDSCPTNDNADKKEAWRRAPKAETSVTQHHLSAGGKNYDYSATAGTLIIRDDDDKPMATMSYVFYTRHDPKDSKRPVLFAFNGGPGSSSLLLHMGLLGPKRVLVPDPGSIPPKPFETVDNEYSLLDRSDLVMVDPVGTGLSHAACDRRDEDFWSVDADVDSVGRFIAQFLSDHNRWTSPKYLMGESYGTTRAAAVVDYLRARRSLTFNGLVLVSMATDMELIFTDLPGNERPYAAFLPAYAAVSWYHHLVPEQPALDVLLGEVRRYAAGPFTSALSKGDTLSAEERDVVAEQVHKYTSLSVDYIKAANLRISEFAFAHELLKSQRKTISRLDGRYVGSTLDPLAKSVDYDPASAAIHPVYTAAFQDYYHGDLKFGMGQTYQITNFWAADHWKYGHRPSGDSGEPQTLVNTGVDLAQSLVQESTLKVLVLSGYFDMGSPFTAAEYMVSHLGLPPEAAARIQIKYYEAGHMMYIHPPSLKKIRSDLDSFIDATH